MLFLSDMQPHCCSEWQRWLTHMNCCRVSWNTQNVRWYYYFKPLPKMLNGEYFENKMHPNVFWRIWGWKKCNKFKIKNSWILTWIQLWPEFVICYVWFFLFHLIKWTVDMPGCFSVQIMLCLKLSSPSTVHPHLKQFVNLVSMTHIAGAHGNILVVGDFYDVLRLKLSSFGGFLSSSSHLQLRFRTWTIHVPLHFQIHSHSPIEFSKRVVSLKSPASDLKKWRLHWVSR